jgi:hypothetical protein
MAVTETHAHLFANAIRLADDWLVEGGDRHVNNKKEPQIIAACDMVDGSTDQMPHAILRALRELAFKLNDAAPPEAVTYAAGATCLRGIVAKLPRHYRRPSPASFFRV